MENETPESKLWRAVFEAGVCVEGHETGDAGRRANAAVELYRDRPKQFSPPGPFTVPRTAATITSRDAAPFEIHPGDFAGTLTHAYPACSIDGVVSVPSLAVETAEAALLRDSAGTSLDLLGEALQTSRLFSPPGDAETDASYRARLQAKVATVPDSEYPGGDNTYERLAPTEGHESAARIDALVSSGTPAVQLPDDTGPSLCLAERA